MLQLTGKDFSDHYFCNYFFPETYISSFKEGVHQFYKFVLKCKVRYTDTAVICDIPQIC